ncbi:MAG TPA: TadE/TadG family type IV pilus assembly protein [Pirellulales bacterium]|jgi:Flp pilus assembly protein TadG|nr:TadE/TadG family type IV pilus assembly protein [Pirellulales bacterium]
MANGKHRRQRQRRARRGVSIVQTALVLNICLIFIFALFDFGRVIMLRQIMENAAREGARLAVVNTSNLQTSDIQSCVTSYLAGQSLNGLTISVYEANTTTGANIGAWTNAGLTNCIAVELTATYTPMTPTFSMLPSNLPMHAKAMMYSEGN